MKNCIFLDIDGVLKLSGKSLNKDCVKNLCDILKDTDTKIVISSDWRIGGIGLESDLHKRLIETDGQLIFDRIIGHTEINDKCRLDQIKDFIEDNNLFDVFCLKIDDDPDVGDIITNPKIGFDKVCKDKTISLLRK